MNDFGETCQESVEAEKNGIIDSMMEVPSSDRVTLKFAYRAIYFSLLCLY